MNEDLDFLFRVQDESKDNFEKIISTFIYHRFEDDPVEDYVKDYEENDDSYLKLYHQIRQGLSKEKQDLLFELDFCVGSNLVITERIRYLQGFKDAFKLFTILNS